MHILVGILFIICAYRLGDWKNWNKYYPTMLFWGFGDLAYNCLFHNKMLWEYLSPIFPSISHIIWTMVWIFTIFVPTALLYLPKIPFKTLSRIIYISSWIILYSFIEWILGLFGSFHYNNGWSIFHSLIFNCFMFPLVFLHFKKPLLAWPFVLIAAIAVLIYFDVPIFNNN
jgi:hypothetical protein